MNEYFTLPTAIPPASLAKSSDVNTILSAVDAGFGSLPTDLGGLKTEVIAARDGKASLLLKEKAQDDAISAVEILATTGFPSQAANAGKFLFTNGATPEWGDPIPGQTGNTGKFLSTDGTVSEWLPVKNLENATASDRTIFNAASTSYIAKARLSDTQTLYAYTDSDGICKSIVATVTESGIMLSNELQVGQVTSDQSTHISATSLSATQAAVSWYNNVDYDAYIRVLTYNSGTNILSAACAAYAYHTQASNVAIYSACCAISSSKIAIFYNNPADSGKLYGQVLSWNGSALSIVTSNVMVHTDAPAILIRSELISGSDTAGKLFVTFASSTNSHMATVNWTSAGGLTYGGGTQASAYTQYAPIVALDTKTVIVFSRHHNTTYGDTFGEIYLYYVEGASPVLVRKHQFTKSGYIGANVFLSANSATKIAPGKAAVMLCTNQNTEHTLFIFSASAPNNKINASNLELLTEQSFSRDSQNYFTLSKTADNNLLYAYQDGDNSSYGTIEKIEVDL